MGVVAAFPFVETCGTALKLSRWMSWSVKERGNHIFFGEYMLACLVLGLFDGFYKSLTDLPFAASELEAIILNGDGRLPREEVDVAMPGLGMAGLDGDDGIPQAHPMMRVPVRAGGADGAEVFCPWKKAKCAVVYANHKEAVDAASHGCDERSGRTH